MQSIPKPAVNDDVSRLLETSEKINSQTLSLTRCVILALLSYFVDGIQFRELKTALRISDGKLISNLKILKKLGYVEKIEVDVDRKKIDVYSLSYNGRKEVSKIIDWMKQVEKLSKEGAEKCQAILTR